MNIFQQQKQRVTVLTVHFQQMLNLLNQEMTSLFYRTSRQVMEESWSHLKKNNSHCYMISQSTFRSDVNVSVFLIQ
jgi:hypothetical protein